MIVTGVVNEVEVGVGVRYGDGDGDGDGVRVGSMNEKFRGG